MALFSTTIAKRHIYFGLATFLDVCSKCRWECNGKSRKNVGQTQRHYGVVLLSLSWCQTNRSKVACFVQATFVSLKTFLLLISAFRWSRTATYNRQNERCTFAKRKVHKKSGETNQPHTQKGLFWGALLLCTNVVWFIRIPLNGTLILRPICPDFFFCRGVSDI